MNNTNILYHTEWIDLLLRDDGMVLVQCSNGAMCVPITDDNQIIFIREPSAYDKRGSSTLLLPAGSVDDKEDALTTANRELQEEIGYKAGKLEALGVVYPWKYLTAHISLFLARDLTPSKLQGDELFHIETALIPLADFEDAIASGRIKSANVISALYLARWYLNNEQNGQ